MTIDPFQPPDAIAELSPDRVVWALRRGGDDRLSTVCYTEQESTEQHTWLHPWFMRPEATKVIPMPLRAYLRAHLNEVEPLSPSAEHARSEFLRAWAWAHKVDFERGE